MQKRGKKGFGAGIKEEKMPPGFLFILLTVVVPASHCTEGDEGMESTSPNLPAIPSFMVQKKKKKDLSQG